MKGALKCSFFAVAALVGAGLLSCCLLRQPASFTAQPTNEQFQDPFQNYTHPQFQYSTDLPAFVYLGTFFANHIIGNCTQILIYPY